MAEAGTRSVSIDEYVDRLGFGAYQWRLLIISGLAWASDAGETMLLSFLGPAARCTWPETSSSTESSLTTVVFVGMALGTLAFGRVADWTGRKRSVVISSALTVLVGLASAFSPSVEWLLFFRMLTGFGIGGVPIVFSMFVEIVPTKRRGMWASIIQTWWSVGTMAVAGLAWWLLQDPGWRVVVAIAAMPLAILTGMYACIVVESPRFLVEQGRLAEAEATLRQIAAINGCEDAIKGLRLRGSEDEMETSGPEAESPLLLGGAAPAPGGALVAHQGGRDTSESYGALDDDVTGHKATAGSPRSAPEAQDGLARRPADTTVSATPPSRAPAGIAACCTSCAGMITSTWSVVRELLSGYYLIPTLLIWFLWMANALGYYGIVLLSTEVRVSGNDEHCANGQVLLSNEDFASIFVDAAAELPGLLMAAFLADLLGRRYSQALGMAVAAIACAALLFVPRDAQVAETAALFVARAFILMSFTVMYLFTPEVYPQHLRATGLGFANMFGRVGGGVAPFIGQGLVQGGQLSLAEGVFSGVSVLGVIAAVLIPVETAGKELGAVQNGPARKHAAEGNKLQDHPSAQAGALGDDAAYSVDGRDDGDGVSLAHVGERDSSVLQESP